MGHLNRTNFSYENPPPPGTQMYPKSDPKMTPKGCEKSGPQSVSRTTTQVSIALFPGRPSWFFSYRREEFKNHQTGKRAKEKRIQYKTKAPPKYDITQGAEPGTRQAYPKKNNGLGSIPPVLELSKKNIASVTWNRTGPQPAGLVQALGHAAIARGPQLNRRRNVKQWPYSHLKTASVAPA